MAINRLIETKIQLATFATTLIRQIQLC